MSANGSSGGNEVKFRLEGRIEGAEGKRRLSEIGSLRDGGARRIVLDLNGVTYIDSLGLGYLIDARQRFEALGKTIVLSGPRGHVRQLFWECGFDKVFEVIDAAVEDTNLPLTE